MFTNGLTPAEAERLSILAEECAEIVQIVCKIQRHGYESVNPLLADSPTNRDLLKRELADAIATVALMGAADDIESDMDWLAPRVLAKLERLRRYTHHQGDLIEAAIAAYPGRPV